MGQYDQNFERIVAGTEKRDCNESCDDRTVTISTVKDTDISAKQAGKGCNKEQTVKPVEEPTVSRHETGKIFNSGDSLYGRHS